MWLHLIRQNASQGCGRPEEHILSVVISVFFFVFVFLILAQEIISSCFFSHFSASFLLVVLFLNLAWRPDCPRFGVRNGLKSAICPVKTSCRIHFPLVLMQLDQSGESDGVAGRA